jgi:ABC-type Fe3+-hydroxamate transport system substrate-binding protein
MLEAAGGRNVFADVEREAVQPSQEMLLTRAPEVIIELRAGGPLPPDVAAGERRLWNALPSIPAVRSGRIHFLDGDYLLVPGPRVAAATEVFARTLHPDAIR